MTKVEISVTVKGLRPHYSPRRHTAQLSRRDRIAVHARVRHILFFLIQLTGVRESFVARATNLLTISHTRTRSRAIQPLDTWRSGIWRCHFRSSVPSSQEVPFRVGSSSPESLSMRKSTCVRLPLGLGLDDHVRFLPNPALLALGPVYRGCTEAHFLCSRRRGRRRAGCPVAVGRSHDI